MAQKPNDPKSTPLNDTQTSILVLISARAIGSVGFAVSLFAIWIGWLLPASLTASAPSEMSEIKKPRPVPKHHRRSASSPTGTIPVSTSTRRTSVPVDLAPILVPHPEGNLHDTSRHVSFADSSSSPVIRRNTMPQVKKPNNILVTSISRHSSPPRPQTPPDGFLDDLNTQDSDSSLSRPSRLQKLKLGFNLKNSPPDKQSDRDSIASTESTTSEMTTKRTSGGFVAAWSNSRGRTAGDDTEPGVTCPSRLSFVRLLSPSTPTTTTTFTPSPPRPTDILSPTFLSRKAERRNSTPIPRTYPYGAPYFASPPVLSDKKNTYPSYLKTLPQFEDEIPFSSARASERGREPSIQRVSLNPDRRAVPKRRSASEDWTMRPSTNS